MSYFYITVLRHEIYIILFLGSLHAIIHTLQCQSPKQYDLREVLIYSRVVFCSLDVLSFNESLHSFLDKLFINTYIILYIY